MSHRSSTSFEQAPKHHFVTKTIHWVSAGLILYGYSKGLDDVDQLADPALMRTEVIFASLLGLLFAVRFIWSRTEAGASRLPQSAPKWEHLASKTVHYGLYVSVFGIVLTGLGIAAAYSVPALSGAVMTGLIALHELSLLILPLLLITHIAGALWHKFVRKDGVMESMTGRLRA